jgi:hypothetical protein
MPNPFLRLTRLALGCVGAAGVLCAGSPRLGFTGGAAWPTGGTRDQYTDSAGYTLGGFADWEQRPGHALRLALDGSFFPRGILGKDLNTTNGSGKAQDQALTLNYVFAPRGDLQGFYLVLGAGAMNLQRKTGDVLHETGVKVGWTAGFGIDFNDRWGLLTRYQSITEQDRNLGTVTAGLTYRF